MKDKKDLDLFSDVSGPYKPEVREFKFNTPDNLSGEFEGIFGDTHGKDHEFWGEAELVVEEDQYYIDVLYCNNETLGRKFSESFCRALGAWLSVDHDYQREIEKRMIDDKSAYGDRPFEFLREENGLWPKGDS